MAPAPKNTYAEIFLARTRLPRPWSARKATLPLHMAFRAADPKGELRSAYGRGTPIASTEPPKLVAIPSCFAFIIVVRMSRTHETDLNAANPLRCLRNTVQFRVDGA